MQMVEGRLETTWNQTSHIMAAVISSQFGRKTPVNPHEVNPFLRRSDRGQFLTFDDMLEFL